MKALSITVKEQSIQSIDIKMQPNTVYSFFNSILIDEQLSLTDHTIHTDANALEENKTPYFLGEQLLLGDALITGKSGYDNKEVTIPLDELKDLVTFKISQFYIDALSLLSKTEMNLYKTFLVQKENENIELNTEWVLYTFNIADDKTKEYFLKELKKSLEDKSSQKLIEKMAQLAMNAN